MRRPTLPPAALAALGYVVAALLVLGPSIRPGHTVVPADALTYYSPYREAAGGFTADNYILGDAATQFLPWLRFLHDTDFADWNPLILGGVPTSPNGYVNEWYPLTQLVRVLDPFDAYDLSVFVHLVVGALGVYALSRAVGARAFPAWLAGLLSMGAGAWLHWSLHLGHAAGMVWLPWALAAVWQLARAPSALRVAGLAAVMGVWLLGANPQYAYFGGLAFAGFAVGAVVVHRRGVGRRVVALAAAMVIGLAIAGPTIVPTAAASDDVVRRSEPSSALTQTHLPWRHGIRVVVPDAVGNPADGFLYASGEEFAMDSPYVGVTAALLAAAAVAAALRRRDPATVLLAIGLAAGLALAFLGFPHAVLRVVVPGYDRFRGSARWVAVIPAFALPLAALGLDALTLRAVPLARRATRWGAYAIGALVGVWFVRELFVDRAPHEYLGRRGALTLVLAAAIAAAAIRRPRWLVPVVTACVVIETGFAATRWFPSVEEDAAYPRVAALTVVAERGGRVVRQGGPRDLPTYLPPDIPMAYGVADVSGLTPVFPSDIDRYLRLVDDYGSTAHERNVAPPLLRPEQALSKLLDPLDVRTILRPGAETAPRLSPGPAVVVPEGRAASTAAMWQAVEAPGWDPARTSAVDGLERSVTGAPGIVRRVDPAAVDRETWEVDAPAGGFLRVGSRFDDGWSATLDGAPVEVHRADGVFRGVVVPPGTSQVVFRYDNRVERIGLVAGGAGLLAVGALVVWGARRREMVGGALLTTPSSSRLRSRQ